jgi:hypothetical protein
VSVANGCDCILLVQDSVVTASAADFDERYGRKTEPPVSAPLASTPLIPEAPVFPPDPQQPATDIARMRAEIEGRMRQEMDALRQQLGQQRGQSTAGVAPAARQQTARALVIGNGAYQHFGRLPNPANDARALAALLERMGIAVDLVLDADRDGMIRALNDYSNRAAGKDVNLLFYAGHGVQVDGVNYLVPTNMQAAGVSAGYIKLAGLSLNAMLEYLPARTRIVFLDACRDNPVARSLMATRSTVGMGLAPVAATSGTLISYATKDGSTAEDGAGMHSPYTSALLQHLSTPQDISIVLRQVRQSVLRATGNRQEPWEYGSLLGDTLVLSQFTN